MKFTDKWIELEKIILSKVIQNQIKKYAMHSLLSEY